MLTRNGCGSKGKTEVDDESKRQLAALIDGEPEPKKKAGKPVLPLADTFDQAMAALKPDEAQFVRYVLAGDSAKVAYAKTHPKALATQAQLNGGNRTAARIQIKHALALGKKAGALQAITGLKFDVTKAHAEICEHITEAIKQGNMNAVASLMKLKMTLHKLDQPAAQQQQGVQIILQSADGVTVKSFGGVPLPVEFNRGGSSRMTQIITFKPAGPVEAAWRLSRAPVKILLGPISSGKSTGAVSHIAELAMGLPPMSDGVVRARCLVVRNTYGALESATLKTINTVFPKEIGILVKSSPMRRSISLPGFELEFILLALDNPAVSLKSALGMEASFAWLDECRELPVEILQTILGRIGRYPPSREVGEYYAPLLATSNMSDTTSWLYQWHEQTPPGVEMFLQPSGLSPEHENKEGLPHKDWYKQQAQIVRPDYRRVMIEAQWGSISMGDAVVPSFSSDMHVSSEPLIISPRLPMMLGLDAGPTHNSAAVIGQMDNGQLRIVDEWFAPNKSTLEAAQDCKQWLARNSYGVNFVSIDPAADNQKDTMSGEFFVNAWRSVLGLTGNQIRPAPTNSVEMRIEACRSICNRLSDGRPALIIDPQCKFLIKALAGDWRFKQKRTPMGMMSEDLEIDKGPHTRPSSDLGDAFAYLVLASGEAGILNAIAKPKQSRGPGWTLFAQGSPSHPEGGWHKADEPSASAYGW